MSDDVVRRLRSKDPNVSGLALSEVLKRGQDAIPDLLFALESDQASVRRLAMEGIGDIGDPTAASEAKAALGDPDGQVRSLAAVALARMGDPHALSALAETLDDWPDLLRSELSRSTYELPRLGIQALSVAIPLLASYEWSDRAKGAWVARTVLEREDDERGISELRDILADFAPDAAAAQRGPIASAAADWLDASGLIQEGGR